MSKKHSILHVGDADISVFDQGAGGPVLVFLHYWGGSARSWEDITRELARTNRCIAIDFRGWGRSSKGAGDYSLQTLANDVVGIIGQLALTEFVLVGHSMGGKVAQLVAAQQPHGLRSLILVAPAPPTPLPTPPEVRTHLLTCLDSREGVESVLPMLINGPADAERRELIIQDALAGDVSAKRAWCDEGMDYDATSRAKSIKVPIHVVIGGRDVVETEAALRNAFDQHYPGTTYSVIDSSGHLIPLQEPEKLADVIHQVTNC